MIGQARLVLAVAVAVLAGSSAAVAAPLPADQKAAAVQALIARSDALNRLHHLGAYAQPPAQEVRALRLRGQALNRIYGLGAYAAPPAPGFDWLDAGIGSATTLGVLLLGAAGAGTVRKRRQAEAL
jgi:hypothetical protein